MKRPVATSGGHPSTFRRCHGGHHRSVYGRHLAKQGCIRAAHVCAEEGFAEHLLLFIRFDKHTFCFVVVVEVNFSFSCFTVLKGRFYYVPESRKGRTEVTENTNRFEIQENTERPLGKYKQRQLPLRCCLGPSRHLSRRARSPHEPPR